MFSLQEKLFSFFGPQEKRDDPRKDAQGRGLKERFMRCLGAEYDVQLLPLVDNFVANVADPRAALARFVPYLENQMGVNYVVSDTLPVRRKLVAWASRITRLKGTKRSYEILLKLMGFATVDISEEFGSKGFDRGKLDDEQRRFDGGCAGCSYYTITLTGTLVVDADVRAWIRSVIAFCEPINARLRQILYNGYTLPLGQLLVLVDANGDLIYDNSAVPDTTLRLLPNGDLQVRGANSSRYTISSQGDLLYY